MRTVFVLLVLGLAAWGLYRFLPVSEVEGSGTEGDAGGRKIPFLERPEQQPEEAPAAPRPPASSGPETSETGAFGLSANDAPSGAAQDVGLAQALLFGGPADVERALSRLNPDDGERRLYLAFAQAATGNRKAGIQAATGLDAEGVLAPADRRLLQAALAGAATLPGTRNGVGEALTRSAMHGRLLARTAQESLDAGNHALAAQGFSEVLLLALKRPWEAERESLLKWTEGLNAAQAGHRWNSRGGWPSVEMTVEEGDSLTQLRQRYLQERPDGLVCTGLIKRANELTGYIHPGDVLRIPTDRASILVDLSSRWLLYLHDGEVAAAWEVGIGRDGQETIQGAFLVGEKQREPTWFPRGQEPQFFPDNPLGTRWLAWYRDGQKTSYGFHGTWEPDSIGKAASDGCIRMRNEDVEVLYDILPVGAAIEVQP